jgi:hypothetical protein
MNALAKKLLIKPNTNWLFYDVPPEKMELLSPLAEGVSESFVVPGSFDGIITFCTKRAELVEKLGILNPLIKTDTIVWLCYPKKSSKIETDLAMQEWDMLPPFNVEAVAAVAFDEQWTCVRIRREGQSKKSGMCVDDIRDNEYGQYIDVDKKLITLPDDVQEALQTDHTAMHNFNVLSYSNRKEYVLWILMAKQQKTREDRLVKMVEKLVAGKKNPSEK